MDADGTVAQMERWNGGADGTVEWWCRWKYTQWVFDF
jgi:hypothetical protein